MTGGKATAGLLAAGIGGALNTRNAYSPLARDIIATNALTMPASLITSELPLQTIAAQVLATTALARRGALPRLALKGVLAMNAASWAGLWNLHREAQRVGTVLDASLADALATGGARTTIPDPPIPPAQVVWPTRGKRSRYLREADLPYGTEGKFNLLDVWARPDLPRDGKAPVLVQIPGGAWVRGKKTGQAYTLMSQLSEHGWICVSISYRLSPKAKWPAHIVDVKRALAWVKANIACYGGDADFVAVTGGSAGGHLSALAALTPGEAMFQPGFENADTRVHAAVPLYGVYDLVDEPKLGHAGLLHHLERQVFANVLADDRTAYELASPQYHLRADAPPMFVIHGANDVFTSPRQARRFTETLRDVSKQPVAFAELPYAQHQFDAFGSVRTRHTVNAIERFLHHCLTTRRHA